MLQKLTWEAFIEKTFWTLFTLMLSLGVKGVYDLNTKVATVISQISDQSQILKDHNDRILYLERHQKSLEKNQDDN